MRAKFLPFLAVNADVNKDENQGAEQGSPERDKACLPDDII